MNISLGKITTWGIEHGITIVLIILGAWILSKIMNRVIEKIVRNAVFISAHGSLEDEKKREDTLIRIIANFMRIFIWIVALFFSLTEFGVPVAPLLTGAGVVGVAVGFGSQSLVKDMITGLFIIAENQYRIGDRICIGGVCGKVENITLRVTQLRDVDGTLHYVPNGEIKITSNKSKDFAVLLVDVGVAYGTDIDFLEELVNRVGQELASEEKYSDDIIKAPHFLRIVDFMDYSISIRITGKVSPGKKYTIKGELRRRLKIEFEKNNIDLPFPIQVIRQES